ncbi:MAG: hypothetical protein IPF99_25160 [Deltaproteobacteria bacterium]|nr:hypothetical protein [Deltaproteobacteria bacterium]MBP6831919.1 hypothetical protein [Deltaproteobacteria bacterium]
MSAIGSLVDGFVPPKGFDGDFGWVCGFSGDADFLNVACDRFTGLSDAQRSQIGRVWLGVMLDPGCAQIPLSACPGALHLLARAALPYRLLHAKVAVLGFRGSSNSTDRCVRLIVSTGNWTRQTLDASLDLAWRVDLRLADRGTQGAAQASSDLRAAWEMLSDVRPRFATDVLSDSRGSVAEENREAIERLESAVTELTARAGRTGSRFFDNRSASLLDQLPAKVSAVAGRTRRNRIFLGSGFFEAAGAADRRPSVVAAIVERLQTPGRGRPPLLTNSARVTLVVNPAACQQVAITGSALGGWSVTGALDPVGAARTLHAKFVFSANEREGSDRCSRAWVYLGSGNLTSPGFRHRALPRSDGARAQGNLEAGVVLAAGALTWAEVGDVLPIDLNGEDLSDQLGALASGDAAPERGPDVLAPPFGFLCWVEENGAGWLVPPESRDTGGAVVEALDASPCATDDRGRFAWTGGGSPVEVVVRWEIDGRTARVRVPVLDGYGRVAGRPLPPLDFDGLLIELGRFPEVRDDEHDEHDDDPSSDPMGNPVGASHPGSVDRTPIRSTMQLFEAVAARQTRMAESDWKAWCGRLEQSLLRARSCSTIAGLREIGINPVSALYRPEFRPSFAESDESPAGTLYEEVLRKVEDAWEVARLPPLFPEGEA